MKVSRRWLQNFFDIELPSTEELAAALTFHVAEIEETTDDLLDVNVLPDRAAYMLSHRGVAAEIAAILDMPMAQDPLAEQPAAMPTATDITVSRDAAGLCTRYMSARLTGVKVGPSPEWLREALASVGQRSINNVVDATNYVMLTIGQPLHAFDAGKMVRQADGTHSIVVRTSHTGERITTLTGEDYVLPVNTLLITNAADDTALAIAGIKGGAAAAVDGGTTEILLEAAHFDGTAVRRTAQALKLFTDASSRFQNRPSPELVAYGMRDVIALITDIAGGTCTGVIDSYAPVPAAPSVSVSIARVQSVLGIELNMADIQDALRRLGFAYTEADDVITVSPPWYRRDLCIAEDLIEEIGRIHGYDRIEGVVLPPLQGVPDQARFRGIEAVRDFLVSRGFTEISTPSFASDGDIQLENPLQEDRPFLRASLVPNMQDALVRGQAHAARVLGPDAYVKLFEIGSIFTKEKEIVMLTAGVAPHTGKASLADEALRQDMSALESEVLGIASRAQYGEEGRIAELALDVANLEKVGTAYAPRVVAHGVYRHYSAYPSALRDVAVWVPESVLESEVVGVIAGAAGDMLARLDLFDRFAKEGRVSYAFRLVFESMERTLADTDIDPAMAAVTDALHAREGWEVR